MYNESVCRHCYLTAEAQEGIVKIWWLELHYFQPYLCCLDLFSCLFQQIRSAFSFPGDILQCRNNSNRKWEPLDDPTGPRVKIDFFSSSEILNCWLFDSSCLRYLSCFFFMWNSCDTFRLDSKHRMQPETTQNRKWESCLSEWLEPTGPPRTLLCEAARMCEKAWACCESHELQRCESKDRRNHLDNIRDVQPLQRNAILKIKSKPMMCFYLFYFLHMVFTQTTVIIRHSRCVYNALIVFRCLLSTTSSKVLANVCAIIILSRGDYGTRGCTREKKSIFFYFLHVQYGD